MQFRVNVAETRFTTTGSGSIHDLIATQLNEVCEPENKKIVVKKTRWGNNWMLIEIQGGTETAEFYLDVIRGFGVEAEIA